MNKMDSVFNALVSNTNHENLLNNPINTALLMRFVVQNLRAKGI